MQSLVWTGLLGQRNAVEKRRDRQAVEDRAEGEGSATRLMRNEGSLEGF
jgi:hypothetical protein